MYPAELVETVGITRRTTPIVHEELQSIRITPNPPTDGFAVANVYTTLGELDRFCEQMEKIARTGLPT